MALSAETKVSAFEKCLEKALTTTLDDPMFCHCEESKRISFYPGCYLLETWFGCFQGFGKHVLVQQEASVPPSWESNMECPNALRHKRLWSASTTLL